VKVFPQQSEAYYDAEFANLKRLGEVFGPNPHVPHLDKDVGTVTEVVRGIMHVAIISLPVCAPVLPQPGGQRLRAAHFVQLLEVLQQAHSHRMYHCDVKPDEVRPTGVRTVYASYTDQHVPSVQREADEFWATHVRQGSMWDRMLQRAKDKDYDGLKSDLTLL
jgi:hypothetical protein